MHGIKSACRWEINWNSFFIETLSVYQHIVQLEIAIDDTRLAFIVRHLEPFANEDLEKLKTFGSQNNYWIYLQSKGPDTVFRLYPEKDIALIKLSYQPIDGISIGFEPNDFTQVNNDINRKMIKRAIQLLDISKQDSIIDLFCGLSNFTLPISKYAKAVIGVDGDVIWW